VPMTIPNRPPGDPAIPKLGDSAILAVNLLALIYSLVLGMLGAGLIVSWFMGLRASNPGYTRLEDLPAWPLSMGTAFLILAVLQYVFRMHSRFWILSWWAYVLAAGLSSGYAALFVYGTLESGFSTLLGPQFLYVGLAMTGTAHAIYMRRAYKIIEES